MIEIILFASIAAFLGLQLYRHLGKRTGHEPTVSTARRDGAPGDLRSGELRPAFSGPAAAGMEAIRAADGVFEPTEFVSGAKGAYEMIVTAFAEGDRETLNNLLSETVYQRYVSAIDAREAANQKQVSDIMRIDAAEVETAELDDRMAKVTVRFTVDLASATLDAEENVVEGDPNQIHRIEELWTFQRMVDADDPNWRLAKVRKG